MFLFYKNVIKIIKDKIIFQVRSQRSKVRFYPQMGHPIFTDLSFVGNVQIVETALGCLVETVQVGEI
jgi:hypothetical protein